MESYEIYWDDLTPEAQERLQGIHHGNIDLTPIAIVDVDDDEDDDEEEEEDKPEGMRYVPISPDGIPFDDVDTNSFATEQEAWDSIPNIYAKRYTTQGYYSSNSNGRIDLRDLADFCTVQSFKFIQDAE